MLGYEITVHRNGQKVGRSGQRCVNGQICLRVPRSVIKAKCAPYLQRGQPARRASLIHRGDYEIVAAYGAE